jgi:hypothetical protein
MTVKRLFQLFGFAVLALGLICAATIAVLWGRGNQDKGAPAIASGYDRPDIRVLSDAHRAMLAASNGADASLGEAGRQFSAATKRGDMLAMFRAAVAMGDSARAAQAALGAIERPAMGSAACASALSESIDQMALSYRERAAAADVIVAAADAGDIRPSQMVEVERLNVQAGATVLQSTGSLIRAYQALGYPAKMIDVEHGGILAEPSGQTSAGATR